MELANGSGWAFAFNRKNGERVAIRLPCQPMEVSAAADQVPNATLQVDVSIISEQGDPHHAIAGLLHIARSLPWPDPPIDAELQRLWKQHRSAWLCCLEVINSVGATATSYQPEPGASVALSSTLKMSQS